MNQVWPDHVATRGVVFSSTLHPAKAGGWVNLLQIAGRAGPAGIADQRFQIADWLGRNVDTGKLPVKPLGHDGELWAWIGEYNPFLGYMAGVLPLLKAGKTGFEAL